MKWVVVDRVHLGELMGLYPCRTLFQATQPQTVIDVGANTGQFSSVMGALLPAARIYAFEPIEECRKELDRRMKDHPDFRSFGVAAGESDEARELKISSFSESSSFLAMSALHKEAFPWTVGADARSVQVVTLDGFLSNYPVEPPILLKLDVQGFELSVLRGAATLLESVELAVVETAFRELYEGQALFDEVVEHLRTQGFRFAGSVQNMIDPKSGQIVQADSLFLRR